MKKRLFATRANSQARKGLQAQMTVGAAVLVALYGLPDAARAQASGPEVRASSSSTELEEVTVTANRREQTQEAVPYNLSVVSADQLGQANVTDLASLANKVPGLSMFDYGARFSAASAPIIRGSRFP